MKSKRSRTYLVSGLTLALIFAAIILVFRDVLPDIVKDLSTVPFWGVLLLLALGFAYEAMESVLCLVIIHHKKPDCTFIDALRVTFLGVFGNIATLGAGTGTDIGLSIESLTYVDNAADDSDSIDLTLDAQDSKWLWGWMPWPRASL